MTIDLECILTISHDPMHNLMKLLCKDSLSSTGCPSTSETYNQVTKIILPSPGHNNISDVPLCHFFSITPLLEFPRFEKPLSSPLSSFLYEFVVRGLEVERGEPTHDYLTLII